MNAGFSAEEEAFRAEVVELLADWRDLDAFLGQAGKWPRVKQLFRALGWSPVANPDDDMPTPPEFDEAIAYNLACKLRPEYGKPLEPDVVDFAQSGLALIRTSVEANTYARLELDLPRADAQRAFDGGAGFYRGW